MRVYVDTNVLVDFVCKREPFAMAAKAFFARGYVGMYSLQTSALSFVTTMYIAHHYDHEEVKKMLLRVSTFVEILDLQGSTVVEMLSSDWKDYEDATQNHTAISANADCIVTRNVKDFRESSLPVYTVEEFLKLWEEND